jgi:DNA-binding transcriptional MocR family regulator
MGGTLEGELKGAITWPEPKGGFFLWMTLPAQLDADRMIPRAVENGVVYVAGDAFFVSALRQAQGAPNEQGESRGGAGGNTMRLSFSAPTEERIEEGVVRLARTMREELDALSASIPAPGQATR